ncbi:unnamed protein product [Rotaria socialis]|uniref:Uncharacterized protein n=1 Tax=Rotaria socialis TaxID=392032 RepID=A0A820S834_9BILA|nr:unnamed protein product [Rotaria socialis]CAF4451698.1 unnamed protein product [Rotaria socialis]
MIIIVKCREAWNVLKQYFGNFNLFRSIPSTIGAHEHQNQKISTIIFIILLILSFSILILYNSIVVVQKTMAIKHPSFAEYSQLFSKYSSALTCPCTKLSIKYENFLQMNFSLHQLCTSDFVTDQWMNFVAYIDIRIPLDGGDFRVTSRSAFPVLRAFCRLTNDTIFQNLIRFYAIDCVSGYVITSDLFQTEAQALINQFIASITKRSMLPLQIIRETTPANGLVSEPLSNYNFFQCKNSSYIFTTPNSYSNCSCSISAS